MGRLKLREIGESSGNSSGSDNKKRGKTWRGGDRDGKSRECSGVQTILGEDKRQMPELRHQGPLGQRLPEAEEEHYFITACLS
jgi:hypothetical protein